MSVICQCPSCKAKYQVDDKYAGQAIKCPNCSSAVGVPAVARVVRPAVVASDHPPSVGIAKVAPAISSKVELSEPRAVRRVEDRPIEPPPKIAAEKSPSPIERAAAVVPPPVPPPAPAERWSEEVTPSRPSSAAAEAIVVCPVDLQAADQDKDVQPPIDDGLLLFVDEPAAPPVAEPPPVPPPPPPLDLSGAIADEPADPARGDAISVPGLAARPALGERVYHPKKKKGLPKWWMPATAAMGVIAVAIVLFVSVIYLARQRKPESESTTAPPVATAATKGKTGPQVPVLTIDWPEDQRALRVAVRQRRAAGNTLAGAD